MDVFKNRRVRWPDEKAYSIGYKAEILPKSCNIFLMQKKRVN